MEPLLNIKNLTVSFNTEQGRVLAVDNVSLKLERGETLGIVGESGSGKSVTAMSALRLIPTPPGRIETGQVLFEGKDLLKLPVGELRKVRGKRIAVIFQEPMTALSPLHRIGRQLCEAQRFHNAIDKNSARSCARNWLERVGIPDPGKCLNAFPYELSGGMRQRVMIAMALMLEPDLIIADEPTTALDVTIQAQILNLMREMKSASTSILLITHDMGVIWEMCDRVAVMYAAEIVETGKTKNLFASPLHPYTSALLASVPTMTGPKQRLQTIPGQVASALAFPAGCRFRERCAKVMPHCADTHPELYQSGEQNVRCLLNRERES